MDWGVAQAKEHGLAIFIEATPEGKLLYERYGLHVVEKQSLELGELQPLVEKNQEIKTVVYDNLLPLTWSSMLKHAD